MSAYYNENDPHAAAWLRELIKAGHVAPGEVDERSIEDVLPTDLIGYTQCHFFAGIGGWSRALRLSGWSDDRHVWTGSCPCQPFSAAGEGSGFADERHLWPAWFHLISQCRPAIVFGEQVAGKAGLTWLDLVSSDLQGVGYAIAAADICAASVGAPHIRQRLYWVGNSNEQQLDGSGNFGSNGRQEFTNSGFWDACEWIECTDGKSRPVEPGTFPLAHGVSGRVGLLRGYGNAIVPQVAQTFIEAYLEAVS